MDREGGGSSIGNTKEAEQMSPIGGQVEGYLGYWYRWSTC